MISSASERAGSGNFTLWLTGRPCAGKTTLAEQLKTKLVQRGIHVVRLDGDTVRGRLNADLGFSPEDRRENLRRIAHVAQLFNENGCPVVATFISPSNELRDLVRSIIGNYRLCYVKCSPDLCEKRDVKGMYKLARAGKIADFTGVSAPFEEPVDAEITVDTERLSIEQCVQQIIEALDVPGTRA